MTAEKVIRATGLVEALPDGFGAKALWLRYRCGDGPVQALGRDITVAVSFEELARVLEAVPESQLCDEAWGALRVLHAHLTGDSPCTGGTS